MADITRYPFIRHLRSEASAHVQLYRAGKLIKSGRGLSFWFRPDGASIIEVPVDDRVLPYLVHSQSADFQALTVQGDIVWRVSDPELLGKRIDFTINLKSGLYAREPVDQVNAVLIGLVRQYINARLKAESVEDVLAGGVAPLKAAVEGGFGNDNTLETMGLELVSLSVAAVTPTSELARALSAPTFESLQQQADEATFARRALAVEKERAIAENELANRIELATRQKQLIAREDANARAKAETKAAAGKIEAVADAERIRLVQQAEADMEKSRMDAYGNLAPSTLLAMAVWELSGKLEKVDSVTITPDLLAGVADQLRGVFGQKSTPQIKES